MCKWNCPAKSGYCCQNRSGGGGGGGDRNLVKTPDYSPWFSARIWKFQFRQNRNSSERASQGERNGSNFSFVASSSEELLVHKEFVSHATQSYIVMDAWLARLHIIIAKSCPGADHFWLP